MLTNYYSPDHLKSQLCNLSRGQSLHAAPRVHRASHRTRTAAGTKIGGGGLHSGFPREISRGRGGDAPLRGVLYTRAPTERRASPGHGSRRYRERAPWAADARISPRSGSSRASALTCAHLLRLLYIHSVVVVARVCALVIVQLCPGHHAARHYLLVEHRRLHLQSQRVADCKFDHCPQEWFSFCWIFFFSHLLACGCSLGFFENRSV